MWLGEENKKDGIAVKLLADELLIRSSSRFFQEIIVAKNKIFGKFLVFKEGENWTMQVTEKWDFYSEVLVHVPMTAHKNPKDILIIGGGDGSTLCQVLKHDVKKVVLVDIDEEVIRIGKEIIVPQCFSDSRVVIYSKDALKFVKEYEGKFDVIIGDYSDPYPDLPAKTLISDEFYIGLSRLIKEDGIIALQAGSPIFQIDILKRVYLGLKKHFEKVSVYCSPVSVYPGGIWCYAIASNTVDFKKPRRIFRGIFYNEEIHEALFRLPTFIKESLEEKTL